jgi:hypothetical protein
MLSVSASVASGHNPSRRHSEEDDELALLLAALMRRG